MLHSALKNLRQCKKNVSICGIKISWFKGLLNSKIFQNILIFGVKNKIGEFLQNCTFFQNLEFCVGR